MNSSVVSFFRFGSTELADTVLAGLAADQFVLAAIGFGAERDFAGVGRPVVVQVGPRVAERRRGDRVDVAATPPLPTWP